MEKAMLVVIPFVVNALLNFVLGLLIALVLGPSEFGLYAIGAALTSLVNAAALDWLKFAAMRFYTGSDTDEIRSLRHSLDTLIAGVTISLSGLLVAAIVLGVDFRLPATLVAVAVAAGICSGLFDYSGTIARAQMKDRAYARLVTVKSLMALVLMVGGAWVTGSAAVVLFGQCLSVAAALLAIRRDLTTEGGMKAPDIAHVRRFAAYAMPLVGANILMATMPLMNRSLMASGHGLAEAGYFSLASDMGIKLFGTLGAALEIILLRAVVRTEEAEGRTAAHDLIARNLVIVLMIVLPVAAGLIAVLPAFEALFVPASFRGHFGTYFLLGLPAFVALALTQAGLNPVFMIAQKTMVAMLATGLGVLVNAGFVIAALMGGPPALYALGFSAALATMMLVTAAVAWRETTARPPWRDMGLVIGATGLMLAALWPLRGAGSPLITILVMVPLGAGLYAACMLAGDLAGCRRGLIRLLRRETRTSTAS
jgi:O-antigen/teichoic acid export membrane protein